MIRVSTPNQSTVQTQWQRPADVDHWRWLESLLPGSWKEKSVVDLGCGSGFLAHQLVEAGASHVVAVDIIPPPAAFASSPKLQFQCLDLDSSNWGPQLQASLPRKSADVVLAFDILEHLQSPWQFLTQCGMLLSRGGQLVLTTANTQSRERWCRPKNWSGAHDPQHKHLFSRYSLEFLLHRQGFDIAHLSAPVRKLGPLASFAPQIGGQMLCMAIAKPA